VAVPAPGVPGCQTYHICYVEACILTNCPTFDGVFEIYSNDCNKPSYALHGAPLAGQFIATKIIPLGYTAFMDGKTGAEELIAKALNDPSLLQSLAAAPKPQDAASPAAEE